MTHEKGLIAITCDYRMAAEIISSIENNLPPSTILNRTKSTADRSRTSLITIRILDGAYIGSAPAEWYLEAEDGKRLVRDATFITPEEYLYGEEEFGTLPDIKEIF